MYWFTDAAVVGGSAARKTATNDAVVKTTRVDEAAKVRGGVLFRRVSSIVAKPTLFLAAVFPWDREVEIRTKTKPHAPVSAASGEDRENATENNSEGRKRRRN